MDLGAAPGNITAATNAPIATGETTLLVLRFRFGVNGTQDHVELFVNPTPGLTPTTPDAARTGADIRFDRLRVQSGVNATSAMSFDEIRFGESFTDVVPSTPGPAVAWLRTASQRVTAGAEITLPLFYAVPDGNPATLALAVTATDAGLLPPDRIVVSGTGGNRRVTFRPPSGVGGTSAITATVTPPGGVAVSATFDLIIRATPEGLLAYEPFNYTVGQSLLSRSGGEGFASAWTTGVPGAPSTSFQVGTSNLPYAGLAHVGTRTRAAAGAAQGLLRVPELPLGEDGTVRYVSFLARPDATLTPTGYFGLLLLGGVSGDLFVGKPGGGSTLKYVLENGGGTLQFPSAKAVTLNEVTFIVVKLEFRSGNDRASLFVNPVPGSPEPLVADAVKEDIDLGLVLAPALVGNAAWSADELRLGTTFASVTPIGASFALKPISTVAAREHSPVTLRIETVVPLSAGRTLSFEWVGESFGATLNTATGEVRWIPGELDGGQLRRFTVRATGNASPTDSDQVSFNAQVTEVNVPPQLEAVVSLLVEEGAPLLRQLNATDADLPSQPLSFTLVTGPDGFAVSSRGLLTWTPTVQQLDNVFPVTVSVFDTFQGTAESSFNVVTRSSSGGGEAVPPPPLFALATDTDVVLAWENRVGTFVLQSAPFLEGAPWLDVAVTPSLADGQNRVARPLTSAAGFFRLVSRGGSARLTGVTPRPGPLAPGLNQFVELTVTGGFSAGDVLEVVEEGSGLRNERRIPAEFLRQPDGSAGFFLDGDTLPIGTPQVSARLVNAAGAGRGVVFFEATNRPADTGGQPPAITGATWGGGAGAARRPFNDLVTLRPPLALTLTDSDADLARLEIRFTHPDGTTEGQIIPLNESGPGPVNLTLFPLTFNRATPVGIWTAEVTAFDRAGHSSGSQTMQLIFGDNVPPGATQPLVLLYFQPLSGVPGDVVEVFVDRLADAGPTNARVRIGGRIAAVIETTAEMLRVVVPTDTAGGPVDVTTPQGSATAQAKFIVLPAPNVEPARAHALANQAIQFHLDRRLSASAVIAWSVTGGGSIGTDGLFRAPGNLAEAKSVTVTATVSLPGTNVIATALVSVEAAPVARASAPVTAAAGGVVWSDDLLARVELPPGALAADATVSIRVLPPAERPAPPANAQLLGAIELGPDGVPFNGPVRVWVPLTRSLAPGETLSLQRRNTGGGTWLNEGVVATVEPDGQSALAAVNHFSLYGLFPKKTAASPSAGARIASPGIGIPCPGGTPPQITRVTPNSFYEGELQPIFIEGTGLDGDVELKLVRADGTDMAEIVLGPLVRARLNLLTEDGTRAAFLLNCPVLPTLGEGQDLPLRIRLRRCGSPDAFFPLLLHGLPEFTPADLQGAPPNNDRTFSRLYSEIVIMSDLQPRFDVTDLRATHGIKVAGKVDVSGRAAQAAVGVINGVAEIPRRFRSGGQGGNPVTGNAEFVALYEFPARQMRVGHRGPFGADLENVVALQFVAGCLGSDARTCFDAILANLHADPFDELGDAPSELLGLLERLPDGRRGASGLWNGAPAHWSRIAGAAISDNVNWARRFGAGSGGGGGGMSGVFYGDPGSRLGGGAGGEGGGAVRLLSARSLELSRLVIADGGPGGNGGSRLIDGYVVNGGGGGGGGAGAVRLMAGESLLIRTGGGGGTHVQGGRAGLGGIATRPENIGFGLIAEVPYTEDAPPPEGMNVQEGSLFDETLLANSVVTRGVLTLEPKRAPEFFSYDGRPGLSLDPNRPHIVVYRVGTTISRKCYFYLAGDPIHPDFRINLLLFPGLNAVELGGSGEDLLNRQVVFLSGPDSDGDGLSDADEIALGTNPAVADTDGDTQSDASELANGSDPRRADTDGDLVPDNVEIALGTLPTNPDSDYDGLSDSLEIYRGQSPTHGNSAAFSYEEGELFAIVENEAGEKLLALLNPSTGKLGALGKVPRNRGDGITFDANGTLYLAQGDELFEWAGSVPYARAGLTPRTGPFIAVGSPGSSGSTGVIGMSPGVIPPPATAGPGNVIADFRTVIDEDGVLKFSKLGNIRSASVLGPFTVAVEAGPLTYDPLPGGKLRINGVRTAAGVVGQTFHLANFNKFTPPLVNVTNPLAHASTAIKALAFSKQTGRFALLAGAAGGNDVLQELDAYNGGVTGTAYPLGRADATALIQAGTNRFIVTTATRELLRVELQPATSSTAVVPLPSTVAPVSRLARVPSVGGCISLNLLTGNGPLGPNFRSEGFLAADFNSDTHNDLAIVGVDGLDVVIHILHGDGTGKFIPLVRHVLGQGQVSATGKLVLAQANNLDALPDLLVAWYNGGFLGLGGRVSVLLGTANGHFAAPLPPIQIIPTAEGFTAGPFDGVGTDDLIFANGPAFLLRGDAAGTFKGNGPGGAETLIPNNLGIGLVELANLNGPANAPANDLICLGEFLATYMDGARTVSHEIPSSFSGGNVMELGDFDGDGLADLFVSGYSGFVRVFPGNGDGTFRPSLAVFSGNLSGSFPRIAVGDVTCDGLDDVIMPDQYGKRALLLQRLSSLDSYDITRVIDLAIQPIGARIVDVNGDGLPDVLLLGVDGTVAVALGQ